MDESCKHETKVVPRENSLSSFEDEGLFLFHAKHGYPWPRPEAKTFRVGKTD
jgi:hypothetical protein